MAEIPAIELYRRMLRVRGFEEEVARRFRRGELPGFVHLSIGQEAVSVGVCSALRREDQITTTHRGHGHVVAKGASLRKLAAELYGSPEGACRGLGGSMHLVDIDQGILCAGAIVGGTIPLATGVAFSFRQRKLSHVAVSFFGDGATSQGVFHECLNLASLWKLPIVYVCENNGYAEMTPTSVHTTIARLSEHGRIYGIPSTTVDGNDVEAVSAAAREAVEQARGGKGPSLVECRTYRVSGHFEGDPQKYKPAGEAESWKGRDPIRTFGETLISRGVARAEELESEAAEALREIEAAFAGLSSETRLEARDLETLTFTDPF